MTLLETTISLGILMMGILASLTLMLSSFNYIQATEDQIVVVNLAREGLEIVRSLRNDNSNPPPSATTINIFSGDYDNQSYLVDGDANDTLSSANRVSGVSASNLNDCAACRLYLNAAGRYTYNATGATPTVYKRLVTITPSPDHSYQKIITSTVSYQQKNKISTYSLETRLTDWQTPE